MKKKRCKICSNLAFETEHDYLYHIKYVHDGKYTDYLICEDCGKQFRTKSELRHHIDSKCSTIKRYLCKVCNTQLMTAGSLHNHMLRHTGERCFMCRFCGKTFLTAGQIKVHERKHTQEKVFLCNTCGKGFSYRQSLITHITVHTGIKPYQCENCGNSFSCIGNLLKHRKSHLDTCGAIALTTHRVNNPSTRIKIKVNTPSTTRLKVSKKYKDIEDKLRCLEQTEALKQNNAVKKVDNFDSASRESLILSESQEKHTNKEDRKIIATDDAENNFDGNNGSERTSTKGLNKDEEENSTLNPVDETAADDAVIDIRETFRDETNDCKQCEKVISHGKDLLRRSKRQRIKSNISCSCCKRVFVNKEERRAHQESEHVDVLTCTDCNKIFSNKDSLKTHQKGAHEKIPRKSYLYICESCGKEFKQKQTLKNHRESQCGTSLRYACEICHKNFSSVYIRNNHMKVHDVKKLLCKFCGKSFHWKGQLKVHERSHTGEKPYICLHCPKAFSYRESLLTHSSIHTGIKPYVCESCGHGFSCIGNLIKHKEAHANICGPYKKVQK